MTTKTNNQIIIAILIVLPIFGIDIEQAQMKENALFFWHDILVSVFILFLANRF